MNFLKLLSLLAVVFTSSITFAKDDIAVRELDKGIYMISLMHYASLVVIGTDDVLITDTANPYRAALLKKEIRKLTEKPVTKIVLSHEHFDHVGGTEVFSNAEIIAHNNIREYDGLDPLNMVPDNIHQTFESQLTIDMGTTTVELHHMPAADGLATAIVYLPSEKIVLSADMYVDKGIGGGVYLTDTNLLGVRNALNTILSWDVKHAINVHSNSTSIEPMRNTAMFLDDLYTLVFREVKKVHETTPSMMVPSIINLSNTLEMPEYKDWSNYQDLPIYIQKMGFSIVHGG